MIRIRANLGQIYSFGIFWINFLKMFEEKVLKDYRENI